MAEGHLVKLPRSTHFGAPFREERSARLVKGLPVSVIGAELFRRVVCSPAGARRDRLGRGRGRSWRVTGVDRLAHSTLLACEVCGYARRERGLQKVGRYGAHSSRATPICTAQQAALHCTVHSVAECQFSANLIITFDRNKIQTSKWYHFVSLVKAI